MVGGGSPCAVRYIFDAGDFIFAIAVFFNLFKVLRKFQVPATFDS